MAENPRPNGPGPRTRPDFADPEHTLPANRPDQPLESPSRKSKPSRQGKLRLISLIVIPIAAAAVAAYVNPPKYGGGATLQIEPGSSAISGKPTRKIMPEVTDSIRSVFLATAWTEARNRDSDTSLELVQTPIVRNPTSDTAIEVISTNRGEIQAFVAGLDQRFQSEYESMKTREKQRQESRTIFLQSQIEDLNQILDGLAAIESLPLDAIVHDAGEEGNTHWSLNEAFRRYWKRLHRSRSRYTGQRMELVETQRQLDELLQTPPPATAIIDPEDRAKAYSQHVVLTGDLVQLKDRLEDVRRAMAKVHRRAEQPLTNALSALSKITECAKGSDGSKLSPEKRLAMERISETASALNSLAIGFAREWNDGFKNLAEQPIDPKQGDVLDFHDRIAAKAAGFDFQAKRLLDKMKTQLRDFREAGSDSAKGHFEMATLTREIAILIDSEARFAIAANGLRDPNEFLLDAALRGSRGLAQRTTLIMKEIETTLEEQARQRAFDERQRKIESLTKSVGILRIATDEIAGSLIETLSKMQGQDNDSNTYLDQVFELETTSAKKEFVERQINNTQIQLKRIEENPVELQFPNKVAIEAHSVSKRPKNLFNLVTAILAAWGTSFIGVLGISRIGRRN